MVIQVFENRVFVPVFVLAVLISSSLLYWGFLPLSPVTAQESGSVPTGSWYTYANGDDILALAVEGEVLWAGTRAGGVVRWEPRTGSYVQFLKPQDGLSGNVVYDVLIDSNGYKWFATDHGLSVLDDRQTADKSDDRWFQHTRESTAGGLPANRVTALALDEAGYLWVGTMQYWDPVAGAYVGGGLSKLDTRGTPEVTDDVWLHTYTFENTLTIEQGQQILGLASDNIADILPIAGNRVWVATVPHWIFEQPDENFPGQWVQTHGGLSRLNHGGTTEPEDDQWKTWNCEEDSEFGCVVTVLRKDHNDYIWAAMRGRGVLYFHQDAESLRPDRDRFTTADGLASNFVDAITFGPSDVPQWANTVWISTYHSINGRGYGVSVLDHNGTLRNRSDDTWNNKHPAGNTPLTREEGLVGDRVQAMVTAGPIIWMGTGGLAGQTYGISPYDTTKPGFEAPLATGASGLVSNYITDIAFGQPGTRWEDQVWVATGHRRERRFGAGVFRLDTRGTLDPEDDSWEQYTAESTDEDGQAPWTGLLGNNVVAVVVEGDHVWLGARQAIWDTSRRRYVDGGVSVFDGEHWAVRTLENTGGKAAGLRSNAITALAVGCAGKLWIGLGSLQDNIGYGINILDPGDDPFDLADDQWEEPLNYPLLPSDLITRIEPDCDRSQMWVAGMPHFNLRKSVGGGVGRYDYTTQEWMTYTTDDGLQSFASGDITGEVTAVSVAGDGAVWIGAWGTTTTSHGEIVDNWPYVPAVLNRYHEGTWSATVFPQEGLISSVAVDPLGMVWVGTTRGGMDFDHDGQPEDREIMKTMGGVKLSINGTDWMNWTPENSPLVSGDVEVIRVGPDGDVWIGTSGWGLMRFHPQAEGTPSTPTATPPPITPSTTATATPTATATATATLTLTPLAPTLTPTATSTSSLSSQKQVYLSFIARNLQNRALLAWTATPTSTLTGPPTRIVTVTSSPVPIRTPTPTLTPTPVPTLTPTPFDVLVEFTCSGWCELGGSAGMRRQVITANVAVEDWRMQIGNLSVGILVEESPMRAVVEAPEGQRVRVEALVNGRWVLACESNVECSP